MTDLNTLLAALYVQIDDGIVGTRCLGRPPLLSDSELVCLAVAQALLGYRSESRWRATRTSTCAACSRTCPSVRVTTSGSARHFRWSSA
jgi:hypothetical protein